MSTREMICPECGEGVECFGQDNNYINGWSYTHTHHCLNPECTYKIMDTQGGSEWTDCIGSPLCQLCKSEHALWRITDKHFYRMCSKCRNLNAVCTYQYTVSGNQAIQTRGQFVHVCQLLECVERRVENDMETKNAGVATCPICDRRINLSLHCI